MKKSMRSSVGVAALSATLLGGSFLMPGAADAAVSPHPVQAPATAQHKALAGLVVDAEFGKKLLTLNWANKKNAKYYKVGLWRGSYIGPIYGTKKARASTFSAAMANLPADSAGVRIVVQAFNAKHKVIAASEDKVRAERQGTKVSISKKRKAVSKIKKCGHQGLVAATGTAATTGVVAAIGLWIPGVDVVTTGGFAAATAGAGAGTFVACLALD